MRLSFVSMTSLVLCYATFEYARVNKQFTIRRCVNDAGNFIVAFANSSAIKKKLAIYQC
jgi:hypothetical protein